MSVSPTPTPTSVILPGDLQPFLSDLAAGFDQETLAGVLTPTLSLFFQEWFKLSPTPDLLGNEWRRYLGAVAVLVQVKPIAALVSPASTTLTKAPQTRCLGRAGSFCPQARIPIPPRPAFQTRSLPTRICTSPPDPADSRRKYGKPTFQNLQNVRPPISKQTKTTYAKVSTPCK
jgi:hypothetical protein